MNGGRILFFLICNLFVLLFIAVGLFGSACPVSVGSTVIVPETNETAVVVGIGSWAAGTNNCRISVRTEKGLTIEMREVWHYAGSTRK